MLFPKSLSSTIVPRKPVSPVNRAKAGASERLESSCIACTIASSVGSLACSIDRRQTASKLMPGSSINFAQVWLRTLFGGMKRVVRTSHLPSCSKVRMADLITSMLLESASTKSSILEELLDTPDILSGIPHLCRCLCRVPGLKLHCRREPVSKGLACVLFESHAPTACDQIGWLGGTGCFQGGPSYMP